MIKKHLSFLTILAIAAICIWNVLNTKWWDKIGVITFDVACYYGYLPKTFNHKTDELTIDEIRLPAIAPSNKYVLAPNGQKVLKTTMGMAILYSPFYAAGYLWHYCIYGSGGTGMEVEYRTAMAFFGVFCLVLCLFSMRIILRIYFTEEVVSLTFLILVFGTNMFYYTTYEGCMAHLANCLLFTLFLYLTQQWYTRPSAINSTFVGLLMGLITLIRPTNLLVGILFLLYNISSVKQLMERILFLLKKWPMLFVMSGAAIITWIPQMLYWHNTTGQYFFFSYVGERFYFLQPRIYSGFLSFRKGWLIYTPLGSLMLIGFIWMYRYLRGLFWGVTAYFIVMVYVTFSWWCWWYGGSFSCRPMVEAYAVLVFPLACFLKFVSEQLSTNRKTLLSVLVIVFVALNIFQTYQYSHQIIHWERMSFAAYKNVFLSMEPAPDSLLTPQPEGVEKRNHVE